MPLRILVVDDDDVSREVIALLLATQGYVVDSAESGDAALLCLSESADARPEVVLTDVQMPGIAGTELARRLREVCGPGAVLLAMSGSEPEKTELQGFDGFLLKPFTVAALEAVLAGDEGAGSSITREVTVLDEGVYQKLAGAMRPEKLEQLYALCLGDAAERVAGMRQAAQGGDDAGYRRQAHAIKGGSGMVGAGELQTLATSMEDKGLGDANHVASLDEFMLACERLRRILVARASGEKIPGLSGDAL